MKKVLITGAAGTLGRKVLKYILSEGKYDVYAIDLNTRHNRHVLRKYRKRVKVIYGDVAKSEIMEDALKECDFVIHLAGVNPPLADLNDNLSYEVDYKGTENIVRILDFYNQNCHLLYASTASVYGKQNLEEVSVNTKIDEESLNPYAKYKYQSELLIKEKLKNYSIYRLPIILSNPICDNYIFSYNVNAKFEVVSDEDAGYMFARALDKIDELNKKTFNVGGGKPSITTGKNLNNKMLQNFGLSGKYIKTKLFIDKNFNSYIFKDSDKLDEILSFRNDSIDSFFLRRKRNAKKYYIRKFFGKLFIKKEN